MHWSSNARVGSSSMALAKSSLETPHSLIDAGMLRLKAEGKPSKVAIVACMRKLLCYANSIVKNF